jgi:hypothetical protein
MHTRRPTDIFTVDNEMIENNQAGQPQRIGIGRRQDDDGTQSGLEWGVEDSRPGPGCST